MNLVPSSVRQGHLRGFTLIELLVVIAIIGILSSVVLASLNTARNKGADAAIKSNLAGARAQAELFYDANGNSYATVCTNTTVNNVKSIYSAVFAAVQAGGGTSIGTGPTTSTAGTCNAVAASWGAEAALKTGGFYCVDSTGASSTSTASLLTGSTDYTC
ncbi:MAG: type II secretion system protein [Patescibacteria group bacterium]